MDYEKAAKDIFPLIQKADTTFLRSQYAIAFANVLGNPGEFYQYVTGSTGEQGSKIEKLMLTFKHNLALLVGKTWVDAAGHGNKEKLLEDVESLALQFESAAYRKALASFIHLSKKLAELIFGEIAKEDDFLEYAFRIDPKLGLFYWYTESLKSQSAKSDHVALELLRMELLIGIYFLTSL